MMWMMHRLSSLTIFAALLVSTLGAEPVSEDRGKDSTPAVKMEDHCVFGKVPSLTCRAKCNKNDLEPYCGIASHSCLCKQPGAVTPTPPPLDNYCWFGESPSLACYKRCGQRGAVCVPDSTTNECRCKEEEEEETRITTPDVYTSTLESPVTRVDKNAESAPTTESTLQHIFDTRSKTDSETTEEDKGQPTSVTSTLAPAILAYDQGHSGWSYHYLIGAAIFFLLALLVGIEVYRFRRFVAKRRAVKLQSVFSQMPDQTKPTKP